MTGHFFYYSLCLVSSTTLLRRSARSRNCAIIAGFVNHCRDSTSVQCLTKLPITMALHTLSSSSSVLANLLPSKPTPPPPCGTRELDGRALIGMTRVGATVVSPDGSKAVLHSKVYDWDAKKFSETLWLVDVEEANGTALAAHTHLKPLVKGSQHDFATANSPQWSPCGKFIAFLSNRGKEGEKTAVWTIPATGPGEATLLKRFPVSVGDLRWEASGIVVSASVYLDEEDPLKGTATRDDKKVEGGLNAHLFKRLPVREWDRWLGAKFAHPFYQPLTCLKDGSYVAEGAAVDGLAKVATACPSGAFGGSEDWSVSPTSGAVALSARPPLAADEAWTTNRHIYLKESFSSVETMCLTEANPGFDFSPSFSPDGSKLAWLTMAGAQYEADAVGVKLYDVATKATTDLIAADVDFAYSPQSLTWSGDGKTIYFTADIRARQRLCAIDVASKAIKILGSDTDGSITIHDEINGGLLVSCESFTSPPELYRCSRDGTNLEQLTFFNKEKLAALDLGVAEDISFRNQRPGRESLDGADIQAWLLKPANFDMKKKYPLAVVIHGGPQGSVSDRWHYRWNLQSYGSAGFAVLAVNFRGSTGMGHAYCRDISGDWSIGPDDTVAGVRHCLEAYDWLDASRVAGLGASYGGFSVNYLNGHAPEGMFKCLVNHDGVFDFRSGYWSTEELFFKEKELGGTPYAPESQLPTSMYQTTSPSAAVDKWKTPTLVIHGDKDFRLVTSEALATFTALQRQGIESEFLFFPDENHWVLNPQNSLVWHNTVLSWIRKYTA